MAIFTFLDFFLLFSSNKVISSVSHAGHDSKDRQMNKWKFETE